MHSKIDSSDKNSTDLNLLSALDASLEEGSVVGAAARLGLTPSAMSRTLGRIRQQTGDPILVRAYASAEHIDVSRRGLRRGPTDDVLDLRFVPSPVVLGRVSIALAWHPRHDGDPVHTWLRDCLRRVAELHLRRT